MLFPVDVIIETLSRGLTLEAGDVIATGTPEGAGFGSTPPEFLQDGDVLETEVEGIGVMRNRIRRERVIEAPFTATRHRDTEAQRLRFGFLCALCRCGSCRNT